MLKPDAFQPVHLGAVGTMQLADAGWSIKHGRDLVAARQAAEARCTADSRCGQAGAGLARAVTLNAQRRRGDALATNDVSDVLMISGSLGYAFGLNALNPLPAVDNAALFCSVLSPPPELPGGLQALATYLLRGGVLLARLGLDAAFATIVGRDARGLDPWQQAQRINGAAWVEARAAVEAGWDQIVARTR
jgi:hypothetical protein